MMDLNFAALAEFALEMKTIRGMFPEFAKEIDRCIYDVGRNHTPKCGEANCVCQWTFEEFHAEQNLYYKTIGEAKSNCEFN